MTATTQGKSVLLFTIKNYLWGIIVIWSVVISASLLWNLVEVRNRTLMEAYTQAKIAYNKDVLYRKWNAMHGGVYVPATQGTPSNPYLSQIKERDITTHSGKTLTLMNPAYMTRQVYDMELKEYGNLGHLTSLNPIRPENLPDAWERKALESFDHIKTEVYSIERKERKDYFRFMRPFWVENSCLKCHGHQGYKNGELRGGISVSIPMETLWTGMNLRMRNIALSHILLWLSGLAMISFGYQKLWRSEQARRNVESEREKLIFDLQESLNKIKTLSGLLPICASCKKIRNDQGYWEQIEGYIRDRSEAEFSHGICPECAKILYADIYKEKKINDMERSVILLVDDEEDFRMIFIRQIKRILKDHEFEFIEASDGEEALELLKRGAKPSIIILDYAMPKMNGLELLRRIDSDHKEMYETPRIMISGYAQKEIISEAQSLRCVFFEKSMDNIFYQQICQYMTKTLVDIAH